MKKFLKRLNEPFPDKTTYRENVGEILLVGAFITMFLYFISPNDMSEYSGNKFLLCLAFGVVTVLISFAYDFVSFKVLKIERDIPSWTLKKWIIGVIILIICIAIGNYGLLLVISKSMSFSTPVFFKVIISTLMIGIIPIAFSGMMIQLRAYKANQQHVPNIPTSLPNNTPTIQTISIVSQNKKNELSLLISDLLFVEAMQNYVSVSFLKEKKIKKEIIRNTLSNVEKQLSDTPIIRCHRSYLVNPNRIEKVEGNAQGLRLSLHYLEEKKIPVSRKFISALSAYR